MYLVAAGMNMFKVIGQFPAEAIMYGFVVIGLPAGVVTTGYLVIGQDKSHCYYIHSTYIGYIVIPSTLSGGFFLFNDFLFASKS
jgi:hypothetical protein